MTQTAAAFAPGIYEINLSGVSTTGCVAYMVEVAGMAWPIGWLSWDQTRHTVEGVWVFEDARGHGVGAALLAHAEQVAGAPLVDSGEYTAEGYRWAKARGLNPKMRKRVAKHEMARMIAQMNEHLIGGRRCARLLAAEEE